MASAVDRRARDHRRVAVVDPADDGLLRYIVRHHRYDAMRRERRHVELVADDNLAEFEDAVAEAAQALAARRHVSDTDPPRTHLRRCQGTRVSGRRDNGAPTGTAHVIRLEHRTHTHNDLQQLTP